MFLSKSKNSKRFAISKVMVVLVTVALMAPAVRAKGYKTNNRNIRNVIVMVPDGCAQSIQTLARWYKGGPLNVDGLNSGTVKTYMANSVITGSAAAATAFATGHKTTARFLGVGPRTDDLLTGFEATADPYVPIASVLEGVRLQGKSTGLVATSRMTHATPAAYACHIHDRGMDNEIMEHMVYQNIDVVFGGGKRHLIPTEEGGNRTDGENLLEVLLARGYEFVETRDAMLALTAGKAWGLFASSHMVPDIDRDDVAPTEPSLSEMTEKAIDLLSQDNDGFLLMVEGSQVDWAGHANDPAYMVTDFLAFDEAVGKALEFAKADGHTLVLIFPDHNTGALSIGHQQSGFPPSYTATTLESLLDPIRDATVTLQLLINLYPEAPTPADVRNTFITYWGEWWNIMTDNQAQEILNMGSNSYAVSEYISRNFTVFGWTTHGHSGEDVPLWAYGPNVPVGTFDNTDLAEIVAQTFKLDLGDTSDRLFVEANGYPGYTLDTTDPANPVVKIGEAELPVSKDILKVGEKEYNLEGIVVYAPMTDQAFVPAQAIHLIEK